MSEHKIETKIDKKGTLILTDLPFNEGESVEVVIKSKQSSKYEKQNYPLRGKPVTFINPTEPISEDDWESNK